MKNSDDFEFFFRVFLPCFASPVRCRHIWSWQIKLKKVLPDDPRLAYAFEVSLPFENTRGIVGGGTRLLLALIIRPLTTHPFRDERKGGERFVEEGGEGREGAPHF